MLLEIRQADGGLIRSAFNRERSFSRQPGGQVAGMVRVPLEVLELEPMSSGHRSIRLTLSVAWDDFGSYAAALIRSLDAVLVHKADSPVERVWTISICGRRYWLSFDDFGLGVSLDPCDAEANDSIETIRQRLLEIRNEGEMAG
jgi:hypothetical protein